jgi:hypothetical protein
MKTEKTIIQLNHCGQVKKSRIIGEHNFYTLEFYMAGVVTGKMCWVIVSTASSGGLEKLLKLLLDEYPRY